jgi:hypothetical protein
MLAILQLLIQSLGGPVDRIDFAVAPPESGRPRPDVISCSYAISSIISAAAPIIPASPPSSDGTIFSVSKPLIMLR